MIGAHIRDLRETRGLSQVELAERVGFSKSLISKLESGRVTIAIANLHRIAKALNVEVGWFFDDDAADQPMVIVRAGERREVAKDGTTFGYTYQSLAHKRRLKRMDPFLLGVPAKVPRKPGLVHDGEEMLFVVKGHINFIFDGGRYPLDPGDLAYFDGDHPHNVESRDGEPAEVLSVYCFTAGPRAPAGAGLSTPMRRRRTLNGARREVAVITTPEGAKPGHDGTITER